MLQSLVFLISSLIAVSNGAVFSQECMNCICKIESNCNQAIGCIWDSTTFACGPYRITEQYWIDCGPVGTDWQTCSNDLLCAEECVKNYMLKFGTSCTPNPYCEDYARIHDGGALGCQSSETVDYWNAVKACCGGQTGCD